jgi:hypothetical protein
VLTHQTLWTLCPLPGPTGAALRVIRELVGFVVTILLSWVGWGVYAFLFRAM